MNFSRTRAFACARRPHTADIMGDMDVGGVEVGGSVAECALAALLLTSAAPLAAEPTAQLLKKHLELLVDYCFDCHDTDMQKGKVDLETLRTTSLPPRTAAVPPRAPPHLCLWLRAI